MKRRAVSALILTLLLTSTLTVAFDVQPVKSDYDWTETIYIQADGSIQPPTAPISSGDNVTYTLTDNIAGNVPESSSAIIIQRNNIIIDGAGHTLQGTGAQWSKGIDLTGKSNVTIKNINIKDSWYGIYLESSSNNSIVGNNITNNGEGIILYSSSSYNSVSGNNITANSGYGIELSSSNNSISGNTFANDGLFVWGSYQNSVENNTVEDNTVNGRPLVYLEGASNHTVADAGQVVLVRCENMRVEGLNLSRTCTGVELWETSNSTISGNNITANNRDGVYLGYSSGNSVSGNNITANSGYGIELFDSSSNSMSGNSITANDVDGIVLGISSNYNSVSGNNITNNDDGIHLYSSYNNNVSGNNIIDNTRGVPLGDSYYNTISGNNITNNADGVYVWYSFDNTVSGNIITANNREGIFVYSSSSNKIFHNSFVNNNIQVYDAGYSANAWDDGYPSGGNYWSDYNGPEFCHGPSQNVFGGDGIGDTPYVIDAQNQDNYPFMAPGCTLTVGSPAGGGSRKCVW